MSTDYCKHNIKTLECAQCGWECYKSLEATIAFRNKERDSLIEKLAAITKERNDATKNLADASEKEAMLHIAICQAVTMMNIGDHYPAHNILRQCLVDYADAALSERKP